MFFVQHQGFWFQKHKLKNTNFWSKGGCNKSFVFTCFFLQNVKSCRCVCPFLGQIWLMFTKTLLNRYFSTFLKAKNMKNDHFEGLLSGPSKGYYLGQVCCNIKMANMAQIISLQIFARTLFFQKKVLKPLFL